MLLRTDVIIVVALTRLDIAGVVAAGAVYVAAVAVLAGGVVACLIIVVVSGALAIVDVHFCAGVISA